MNQPLSSLNLPEFRIEELRHEGYIYCDDINSDNRSFKINVDDELNNLRSCPNTKTALDIYQEEGLSGSILTLHKELDDALEGGVPTGLITEFCGDAGSGKTQLCLQLCVSVQLPKWCGGLNGEAVYISTNKGFTSHRLKELAEKYVKRYEVMKESSEDESFEDNLFNVKSILERIHYMSINNDIELLALCNYLEEWIKDHKTVRLVVIDNICTPFKSGHEKKHITLYHLLNSLQRLAEEYSFAIVLTNNFTTSVANQSAIEHIPSLGNAYFHRINIRIILSRTANEAIRASIVKSIHRLLNVQLIL